MLMEMLWEPVEEVQRKLCELPRGIHTSLEELDNWRQPRRRPDFLERHRKRVQQTIERRNEKANAGEARQKAARAKREATARAQAALVETPFAATSLGVETQWQLLAQVQQEEEQPSFESPKKELHSAGFVKVGGNNLDAPTLLAVLSTECDEPIGPAR